MTSGALTTPLDVVKTRLQTAPLRADGDGRPPGLGQVRPPYVIIISILMGNGLTQAVMMTIELDLQVRTLYYHHHHYNYYYRAID